MVKPEKQPKKLDALESRLLDIDSLTRDAMNHMRGRKRDISETIDLSFETDVFPANPEPNDTEPGQASES
jgi:hypothetical protein